MKKIAFVLFAGVLLLGCKEVQHNKPLLDSDIKNATKDRTLEEVNLRELNIQNSAIKIIPIEHATAVLEWNDIVIYIDPIGGSEAFKGQKQPDLILITDIHGDHFSLETLRGLEYRKG